MAVFLKSRYDILLNRPGVEILNKDTLRRFIWGDRGSGRTSYLMHDMRTQISQGKTALFVTGSKEMVREVRRRCLEDSARHSISFPERLITFTSYKSWAWVGCRYNCLYFDDFESADLSFLNSSFASLFIKAKRSLIGAVDPMPNVFSPKIWDYVNLTRK